MVLYLVQTRASGYAGVMNLEFYKLQTGGSAWILIDAAGAKTGAEKATALQTLDYSQAARLLCHRLHGAAADGLVLIESGDTPQIRFWNASGESAKPRSAGLLCAARWCFDTGQARGDSLTMQTSESSFDIMAIDPRIFSLQICQAQQIRSQPARLPADHGRLLRASSHYTGSFNVSQATGPIALLDVWDGPLPPKAWPGYQTYIADRSKSNAARILAGVINRHEIRLKVRQADPLLAAALTVLQADSSGQCENQVAVYHKREEIIIQKNQDGALFGAARVHYCLTGEYWIDETVLLNQATGTY